MKLVPKDRDHMSPGLASVERGRMGNRRNCIYFFKGLLLRGANVGKWVINRRTSL